MEKKLLGILISMLVIIPTFSASGKFIKNSLDEMNYLKPLNEDQWVKTFGGKNYDVGVSVQQTIDDCYIVLGYTDSFGAGEKDFWLIKTDSSGNKLWDKTYGGEENDLACFIQLTSDGGYILIGYTNSFGAGNADIWLIKTDYEGNIIWDKTFGGTNYDYGSEVRQTSDGGYIILGFSDFSIDKKRDFWLIKTDSEGNKIWDKTFGDIENDEGASVQQTMDGGYVVLGKSYSTSTLCDIWLIKTDSNGEMQWNKKYGGDNFDEGVSIQQTIDEGYIIIGETESKATFYDIWVIKLDSSGAVLWDKIFTKIGDNMAFSVQQIDDGGYILLGNTWAIYKVDALLVKLDSSGEVEWKKTYGGISTDIAMSVQQTKDGGFILTGDYTPGLYLKPDLWLINTDRYGNAPNSFNRNMFRERMFSLFPLIFRLLDNII